mmetsp:Transcript_57266/g.150717  ORF Transcript_57266/g.150717 Transcript_57266/m.150717 type:complete len:180 (+) Transcript_57266:39-578(+)
MMYLATSAIGLLVLCAGAQDLKVPSGSVACPAAEENTPLPQVCEVDQYVGSYVIHEDDFTRVWNLTLLPGETTSMHSHDFDYSFLAYQPSRLAVWGADGRYLFTFDASGTLSFRVRGDLLEPAAGTSLPFKVPRVHAAKNVGPGVYRELLFESKTTTNKTSAQVEAMRRALGMTARAEL